MGRRSDHSLDQIREMAIEAAEKIVSKKGVEELSTRKIAAEIGYTSGTLYLVFKNFDDLIMHVNGRTLERLRVVLSGALAKGGDPKDTVKEICRAYMDFADQNRPFWSLVYERHWPEDFKRPLWYQSLIAQCFAPMVTSLKALDPNKNESDVTKAAQALWGMVHGTHALFASGRAEAAGIFPMPDLIDFQLEIFLKGFSS